MEQKEFDSIYYKYYLAEDKIHQLEKENKELQRKNRMLLDRIIDYANRLGIKIDTNVYGGNIL